MPRRVHLSRLLLGRWMLFSALNAGAPMSAFTTESVVVRAYTTSQLFHVRNEALQRDPRFARVCVRLRLVDYWRESDKWPDCAAQVPYDFKTECEKAVRELANVGPH